MQRWSGSSIVSLLCTNRQNIIQWCSINLLYKLTTLLKFMGVFISLSPCNIHWSWFTKPNDPVAIWVCMASVLVDTVYLIYVHKTYHLLSCIYVLLNYLDHQHNCLNLLINRSINFLHHYSIGHISCARE